MKHLKRFNESVDEEIWKDFKTHLDAYNQSHIDKGYKWSTIELPTKFNKENRKWETDPDEVYDLVGLWKMLPIKLSSGREITKKDVMDNLKEAIDMGHLAGIWGLKDWLWNAKNIDENGGEIYRLVFLKDKSELKEDKLGNHWTYDLNSTEDFYIDYAYRYYKEHTDGREPHLLTAEIPGKIGIGLGNLDRPEEREIYIPDDKQNNIKLKKLQWINLKKIGSTRYEDIVLERKLNHIKLFNESLEDEYKQSLDPQKIKDLDQIVSKLPEDMKNEFMYRVSDGEDHVEVLKDMLDGIEDMGAQFGARVFIWMDKIGKRSEEDKQIIGMVTGVIKTYKQYGIEPIKKMMIAKGFPMEGLITMFKKAKELFEEDNEDYKWVYQRDTDHTGNIEKVNVTQQMIDELNI